MKKHFLTTVSLFALSTAGHAADLPRKAPFHPTVSVPNWTGAYLGIQGGVARHSATVDTNCLGDCATFEQSKTGGTAGALVGYNFQQGSFLYGIEADWNWTGAKMSQTSPVVFNATSFDVDWVATLRGRVGLAIDATLIYLTGGIALGQVRNSIARLEFEGPPRFSFNQNKTKAGWTAGVGVEHMFSPHWTARAEFRYVDLGMSSVACTPGTDVFCADRNYRGQFSNTLVQGLVGLAYKF